jgi:DNA-binding Lrp family transcriptional regulator
VDGLDTKIIHHLFYSPWPFQWNIRRPFAEVARQLGVTDDTVRARVRRMQESGLLSGWETVINPSVLGRQVVNLEVPGAHPEDKEKAMEMIGLLDGVRCIFDLEPDGLRLMFFQNPGPSFDRLAQLVSKICGADAIPWTFPTPKATRQPSPADWRLIAAIRKDPRRSMKDLEESTGMSRRTVQRRLARLIEAKAVFIMPELDLSKLDGHRMVSVCAVPPFREGSEGACHVLEDEEQRIASCAAGTIAVGLYIMKNHGAIEDLETRMKERLGPQADVKVHIIKRRITCHPWLDDVIAARAEPRKR